MFGSPDVGPRQTEFVIDCSREKCSENLIHLNDIEEKVLSQPAKINWIRMGDGNNSYFHASIKSKQRTDTISQFCKDDGIVLVTQKAIADEVLTFYSNLRDY